MEMGMKMTKTRLVIPTLLALAVASLGYAQETRTYFTPDDLGSPVIATDENGNTVWTEAYTPFGERYTLSASASNNSRWFTGAPQNSQTGLIDLGNRQYDPVIGRFLSNDPVGVSPDDPFSFSRYDYANNNPYSYLDPDGLSIWTKLWKFAKNGGDISLTLAGMKQDWDTLTDPTASFGEHLVAGLSLASEILPVSGRDVKEGTEWLGAVARNSDDVPSRVRPVNGRAPINSGRYAGRTVPLEDLPRELRNKYPHSVPFSGAGFPDFSRYSIRNVRIEPGSTRAVDFARADRAAGYSRNNPRPDGYTWHHHQDTGYMQLVPTDLHDFVKHTGGIATGR